MHVSVVESCDLKSFPSVLRSKLMNKYDEGVYAGVADIGTQAHVRADMCLSVL